MIVCEYCGQRNQEGREACAFCGGRLQFGVQQAAPVRERRFIHTGPTIWVAELENGRLVCEHDYSGGVVFRWKGESLEVPVYGLASSENPQAGVEQYLMHRLCCRWPEVYEPLQFAMEETRRRRETMILPNYVDFFPLSLGVWAMNEKL